MQTFKTGRFFHWFMMLLSLTAIICFTLSLLLSNVLPDFWKGFLEGVGAMGICLGVIQMLRCLINKSNPFTGEPLSHP